MHSRLPTTLLIAFTAAQCLAQGPPTIPAGAANRTGIIAGPDTTVVNGPRLADGSIDYASALNAEDGRGISAEKNAASLLLRIEVIDPNRPEGTNLRVQALRLIGAQHKPADDVTWQNWKGFAHSQAGEGPDFPTLGNRFTRAQVEPWSARQMPELAAWLESNKRALSIAEEASKCPNYWMPILHHAGDRNVLFVEVDPQIAGRLMNLRDAFCIRSMLKLRQGDAQGAFHDVLILQRLLSLVANGDYDNAYLYSGLQSGACYTFWRVIAEARLNSQQLGQWSAELDSISPVQVNMARLSRRPHYDFLSAVQELARVYTTSFNDPAKVRQLAQWAGKADMPVPDWNLVLRKGNTFYDDLEQNLSPLPEKQRTEAQLAFDHRLESISKLSSSYQGLDNTSPDWLLPRQGESNDAYNERLCALGIKATLPDIRRMCRNISNNNERMEWTDKVGVALARYRVDHDRYPANLQALVTQYIAKLPENSTPVVYEPRKTGYVIHIARDYSPDMSRALAKRHLDYDPPDVLIRTDQP